MILTAADATVTAARLDAADKALVDALELADDEFRPRIRRLQEGLAARRGELADAGEL